MAANDYITSLACTVLLRQLRAEAPEATLSWRFAAGPDCARLVSKSKADLGVGHIAAVPAGCIASHLFDETFCMIARAGHPYASREPGLEAWLGLDHVLVSFIGGLHGMADTALAKAGLRRRVVTSTPLFLTACSAVAESDLVAAVPERLARREALRFGLAVLPLPFPVPPFSVTLLRHESLRHDPAVDWLEARLRAAVSAPGIA